MAVRTDLIQWHTQQDKSISDINIQLYFEQKKNRTMNRTKQQVHSNTEAKY